ncbi:L,D-transpeptidase [Microbacterium sp. C7(2022)]|uniref:L,D-transpeptidase n=1 Tax=Microbacterium sp. C7(2022) TaxID=2992759 RepID=UPI00237AAC6D|nr:L,D-transpeptidase [Microbacterium sp. C7(2022)]
MTDTVTRSEAENTEPPTASGDPEAATQTYEWAPAEPVVKKRRTGLWVGIGIGGAAILGTVAASLILIAPGTTIGGVSVGLMTPGAAADALNQHVASTTVVLAGDADGAEVTGADLGASVDAATLADDAFAAHPMWNVTEWFTETPSPTVTIDAEAAASTLHAAAPEIYVTPTDATLAFDAESAAYVTTPAVDGAGIDPTIVLAALQDAFDTGATTAEVDVTTVAVPPLTSTESVETTADTLNGMLSRAGFYIGDERVVPIKRATAASWLTVTPNGDGTFAIAADSAAIQDVVDGLAEKVNRDAVDATVITNSDGGVIRTVTEGVTGRALGDTSGVADEFAAQLASGDAVYELPAKTTDFETTSLSRRIEVDLGDQRTYLFENGKVVKSYAISSGKSATPTATGYYKIFAHVPIQDMGCYEGAPYCTEDVKWVTWFNGDQGFHGTYWHNNFGTPMSHGCVNMPDEVAKYVYDWAPDGTEVWVHA